MAICSAISLIKYPLASFSRTSCSRVESSTSSACWRGAGAAGLCVRNASKHLASYKTGHGCATRSRFTNGLEQGWRVGPLEQVAAGPSLHDLKDPHRVFIHGVHHKDRGRECSLELTHTFDTVHARQVDVHEHHVRFFTGWFFRADSAEWWAPTHWKPTDSANIRLRLRSVPGLSSTMATRTGVTIGRGTAATHSNEIVRSDFPRSICSPFTSLRLCFEKSG